MGIEKGDFIKLNYSGMYNSTVFQTTWRNIAEENGIGDEKTIFEPIVVCVGQNQVITGLDEELPGKEIGDSGDVIVTPDKGFGEHNPDLLQSFNKKDFDQKVSVGTPVQVAGKGEGVVVDTIGNKVIVDFNLPLAGKELTYHYEIVEKVTDPTEQLAGLTELYCGRKLVVTNNDDEMTITLPPGITYDKKWVYYKPFIIDNAFKTIPSIKAIIFTERFEKP
ncbi:MAG: peptidylprolyl isomerase [Methanospirillaceae archaeon]|nr:peptidylprolyl isomerase [Methanospirillaceae archaeon]